MSDTIKPPAISINDAIQAKNAVEQALAALLQRKVDLMSESSTLKQQMAALWTMPLRRDEAKAFVLQTVDALGASFTTAAGWPALFECFAHPRGHRPSFSDGAFSTWPAKRQGPLCMADIATPAETGQVGDQRKVLPMVCGERPQSFIGNVGDVEQLQMALCFFFGDTIKARLAEQFDTLFPTLRYPNGSPEGGSTVKQRREEIDRCAVRCVEIEAELQEVERQHELLKGSAK